MIDNCLGKEREHGKNAEGKEDGEMARESRGGMPANLMTANIAGSFRCVVWSYASIIC